MQSLSWVPLPTQPPRTKCSRSSIVLVFNLVFSPRDLYYRGHKKYNNTNNNNNKTPFPSTISDPVSFRETGWLDWQQAVIADHVSSDGQFDDDQLVAPARPDRPTDHARRDAENFNAGGRSLSSVAQWRRSTCWPTGMLRRASVGVEETDRHEAAVNRQRTYGPPTKTGDTLAPSLCIRSQDVMEPRTSPTVGIVHYVFYRT